MRLLKIKNYLLFFFLYILLYTNLNQYNNMILRLKYRIYVYIHNYRGVFQKYMLGIYLKHLSNQKPTL